MARLAGLLAGALALTVLAGCSDDSGSGPRSERPTAGSRTPTTSATTAYPSGAPSGTDLTEPGSEFGLGEAATIAWQPRQGVVGALRISVDRVQPTTFKRSFRDWKVNAATRTYAPYFVRATVTNLGAADLAGSPAPLYGRSAADALVEASVFKETFKPCHPSVLPTPFPAGASARVCLVYLVPDHGQLAGVAFRPTEEFDPIVWEPGATPTATPTTTPTTAPPATPTGSVAASGASPTS